MTAPAPFQIGARPRFHDGHLGAALLVYLTARPEYPSRAALTTDGILHIHLQTLRRGARLDQMLIGYLARHLGIPEDDIEIAAGEGGAGKIVCFYNLRPRELERRLRHWLALDRLPRIW